MTFARTISAALCAVLMALCLAAPAFAADIRNDMLKRDHERCILGCVLGNDPAVCQVLCDCSVRRFSELDQATYTRLRIDMNSGRITEDSRAWLDDTARICAAEVDAAFPELAAEGENNAEGQPEADDHQEP